MEMSETEKDEKSLEAVPKKELAHALKILLFFAGPFIGLAYVAALPIFGSGILMAELKKLRGGPQDHE